MNIEDITVLTVNALTELGFDAYKSYAPDLKLEQIKALKVYVMPSKVEYETLNRGAQQQMTVDIECGFYASETALSVAQLLADVHSCASYFASCVGSKALSPGVNCIGVQVLPVYDGDNLRQYSVLSSVLKVTYKLFFSAG